MRSVHASITLASTNFVMLVVAVALCATLSAPDSDCDHDDVTATNVTENVHIDDYDVRGPQLFRDEALSTAASVLVPGERVWAVMWLRVRSAPRQLRLLEVWACSPGPGGGMPTRHSADATHVTGCHTPSLNIVQTEPSFADVANGTVVPTYSSGNRWLIWTAAAVAAANAFAPALLSPLHAVLRNVTHWNGAGLSFMVDPLVSTGSHAAASPARVFLVVVWTVDIPQQHVVGNSPRMSRATMTTTAAHRMALRYDWVELHVHGR